jgi:2,5-diketo-D-gluconate reductase A
MKSTLTLNDGRLIPQIGFGTWKLKHGQAASAVCHALQSGYRLIDCAAIYANEEFVGEGIRRSGVLREEVFLTTKLWNPDQSAPHQAMDESLARLGVSYVDLYLIHWPTPKFNLYVEAWRALIELRRVGEAKSIGVSNFTIENLKRVIGETGVVPSINQIELYPL